MVRDTFTKKMFCRLLLPSAFSAVGLALSDMADALVVGRRMGAVGLAAIGISLPLYMVLNVCMHGFGIGGSVLYSKLLSEGRKEEATEGFNHVLRASLTVSVLIAVLVNLLPAFTLRLLGVTAADGALYDATLVYVRVIALGAPLFFLNYILNYYLRNDDNAKLASLGFLAGNGVDIGLNILFVTLLDFGTAGAAWATLVGLAVSVACYLPGLTGRDSHGLRLSFHAMKPDLRQDAAVFRSGFSTSSQYLYQMAFLLIANNVLVSAMGEVGVAVLDMVQNASYLIIYLYDGAAKALQPLASTLYGEKNMAEARHARNLALTSGLLLGFAAILAVWSFPEAVCRIFGLTEPVAAAVGVRALRCFCFGASFAGVSIILESYCQSIGEDNRAFVIALLRGGLVLLPATLLLSVLAPEYFWYVFPVTETASLLVFLLWSALFRPRREDFDRSQIFNRTIRSRTDDIGTLTMAIEDFCDRWGADTRQKYFVTMSAEEISLAIIEGGFEATPDGVIEITLIALPGVQFELHIRDNAVSFNPFSLETAKAGGEEEINVDALGIFVVKQEAKSFFYRRYQGFNSLVVRI